ncbi:MAG: hypothetical protein WBX15_11285 [Thermoanaerobaculia bacterium]
MNGRMLRLLFFALSVALASGTLFAAGPYQFYSVTPCRVIDTRGATGATGGPALAGGAVRSFPINGICGVPADAKAVVVNVVVVSPTGTGHIRLYPYNTPMPTVATLNFEAGDPAIANGAILPATIDPTWNFSVYLGTGTGTTAQLVVDVSGYFR